MRHIAAAMVIGEKKPLYVVLRGSEGTLTFSSASWYLDGVENSLTGHSGSGTAELKVWHTFDSSAVSAGMHTGLLKVNYVTADGIEREDVTTFRIRVFAA